VYEVALYTDNKVSVWLVHPYRMVIYISFNYQNFDIVSQNLFASWCKGNIFALI
jgi:hypothetical protein